MKRFNRDPHDLIEAVKLTIFAIYYCLTTSFVKSLLSSYLRGKKLAVNADPHLPHLIQALAYMK